MSRALEWIRSLPSILILLAIIAGLAFLGVSQCNRAARVENAAAVAGQVHAFAEAGIATLVELSQREVAGRMEAAQRYTAGLEGEVARARQVVPGLRPVIVVQGSTGQVVAGGSPAGGPGAPEAGGGLGASSLPAAPPARDCLLRTGDSGEVRVSGAALKSDAGAVAVVGVAEAWGNGARLFGGPLRLEVAGLKPPRLPGWSYGIGVGATTHGIVYALKIESPPVTLPLVHWPARAWAVGAGSSSQALVLGGIEVEP